MFFLYDNLATFAVAILACGFSWLYGGIIGDALLPIVPWLFVLLLEAMLFFPQRHKGETTYGARERVWRNIRKDKLTWVVLFFLVLLMIPFVNKGLCPICDYPEIQYAEKDPAPPLPFLPFCVNRLHHLNVVMWFVPALTAMIAVRHALLKRGKRRVLEIVVWNGMLLSLVGILQQVTNAPGPLWQSFGDEAPVYFFSTFGYPNMGGDYFTTLFGLSLALWRWRLDDIRRARNALDTTNRTSSLSDQQFWRKNLFLIPAGLFFFSAITTLSRAAILLVSALAVLFFIHSFMSLLIRLPKVKRFKMGVVSIFAVGLFAVFAYFFTPEKVQQEVNTLNTFEILDRVTGRGQYHERVAFELWKDHPFFGCGGWGYKHFCISKMTDKELAKIQRVGGINVHNDYLQFLTEHGAVGFGCLFAIVVMLLIPTVRAWRDLLVAARFTKVKEPFAKPLAIFVLPPSAFFILFTLLATLIHAFGDCPLRSPAVLTLFFVALAAIDGFLPRVRKN